MNAYLRVAQAIPAIKEQAIIKLEQRRLAEDGTVLVRARNADGTFKADDPSTPDIDEAWVKLNH